MNRQRPRPLTIAAKILPVAIVATISTIPPPSQGFVMPGTASRVAAAVRNRDSTTAAGAGRLQGDPRLKSQVERHRRRKRWTLRQEESGSRFKLDPDDPLPRTMDELYRQIASEPPSDPEEQYRKALEPGPEDMNILEEAVRTTFKCTEDNAWWENNEAEWDRMAENPGEMFALGDGEAGVWGMEDYFGEDTTAWKPSDEMASYTLGAYKAGLMGPQVWSDDGYRRRRDAAELFALTPFAQYWDEVPDLRATGRVYAYNAVDRMAALKFLMNFTYNGMHGSEEDQQSGHFLWGYADQLDWMRRSGRLSSTPGSIRVDPSSWWGRVSYALTIIPLEAARQCGAAVSILGLDVGREGGSAERRDDLQRPELRRAVRAWKRLWSFNDPEIAARVRLHMPVHDSIQERVRRAQWVAHLESLDAVETLYGEEFGWLPSDAEREFARGWCRAARLFAEAAAHTNLDRCLLPLGAGYAPERMLTGDDDDGAMDKVVTNANTTAENGSQQPPESESAAAAVMALNTRRCVSSVRWLGGLRAPAFGALRRLWRRSCGSYPARREAARVLRQACYGTRRAKAAAWGRSLLFAFVPDLNYRKLTFPLGVDPAEEVEYDPDFRLSEVEKPPRRPPGSRPSNPLQRPWYDGRKPDPSAGTPGAGWGDDDDGLWGDGDSGLAGLFPPRREPVDLSFVALQRRERELMQDLRAAQEHYDLNGSSDDDDDDEGSGVPEDGRRAEGGSADVRGSRAASGLGVDPDGGESARSPNTVSMFM